MKNPKLASILLILLLTLPSFFTIPVPALPGKDTNLDIASSSSFLGEGINNYFGSYCKIIKDINGDGYDDILISADNADGGATSSGVVYLFFGSPNGWPKDTSASKANASFQSNTSYEFLGRAIASVGDVNGDGLDDIVIGDPYFNWWDGKAGLFFGKRSGWHLNTTLDDADVVFNSTLKTQLGYSIDGVGDVNRDGYDDFIISAPKYSGIYSNQGITYLIAGKAHWSKNESVDNIALSSFEGENGNDQAGEMVSAAGDVNGDGFNDFLIASPQNNEVASHAGQVYLVLGRASGWQTRLSLANVNASFTGEMYNATAGGGLASGGDLNGDGYDDMVIGAPYDAQAAQEAGQAYVVFGRPSGWQMDTDLSKSNASFTGINLQHVGGNLADNGDLNGDGIDDLVIGVPTTNPGTGAFDGKIYIVPGKTSGWAMDTAIVTVPNSLIGQGFNENAGRGLSIGGDVDRDGLPDILIGAAQNGQVAQDAGKAYLVHADHNLGPSSTISLKAYSDATFTTEKTWADIPSAVYIELKGPGGSPSRIDTAVVNVTSTSTPRGFKMGLLETGASTNDYRGILRVRAITKPDNYEIGASFGAMVNLTPINDLATRLTIAISPPLVRITPINPSTNATEDKEYKVRYASTGKNVITKWTFTTDAKWLSWDGTAKAIDGTPDNSQVSIFNVSLKAEDGLGNSDTQSFKVTVQNAPPHINTTDVTNATQGVEYRVDYNADDEGQGHTSWSMTTNALWLHLNSTTGVLNGTPGPWDVKDNFAVKIVFDDGNGANTSRSFILRVINVNDPPKITTADVTTVLEKTFYIVKYSSVDPDANDTVIMSFSSNASWLSFNATNNTLFGLPSYDDVGSYWVNITAMDKAKATDHHNFTLIVVNINDPPVMTNSPPAQATVLTAYRFKVNITDPDTHDIHTFTLPMAPANMSIDTKNGTILWYPNRDQRGTNPLVIAVSDGNATVTKAFDINVLVPKPTLRSPGKDVTVKVLNPELIWEFDIATDLTVHYDVYVDRASPPAHAMAVDYAGKNVTISKLLTDKGQYYWAVVPRVKAPNGAVLYGDPSETWAFKVDTGFVPDYTVLLDVDNSSLVVKRGSTIHVQLTVQNKGNVEGNVTLDLTSDLPASAFVYQNKVFLKPKTTSIIIMTITVPKDYAYGDHTTKITASFGNYTSTKSLKLTVQKPTTTNLFSGIYLVLWIALATVIAGLIGGVAYMSHHRKKSEEARVQSDQARSKSETELAAVKAQADTVEDFTIDEIFLIYQDGRLISHVSYTEAHIDNELFSSMLIALQGFVKESFQTEDGLSRFDYGTRKMILERGQYLVLAVALSGPEPKVLKENMHILIQKVEGLYAGVIENWDGIVEHFKDVNLMLAPLFDIKKGLKIKKEKEEVTVRSGIEFFGGYVRLKVAVSNDLSTPISDVELAILFDQMTMRLSHIQPDYPMRGSTAYLTNIEPNEKRTVAFYLDPLICQESHVDATVKFKDPYGTAGEAMMKRRPVDIVCPIFYTPENINVAMLKRLLGEIQYKDNRLYAIPEWTDLTQVYELARQTVSMHDIQLVRSFKDPTQGTFLGEAWYYGKTKETHEEILLKAAVREQPRSLEVQVASSNISSLTGLLAEVGNNILKLCQEKGLCTLVPCTDKEWKDYIASCETMLDRYGRQQTDGQTGVPGPPAAP